MIECLNCGNGIDSELLIKGESMRCPSCNTEVTAHFYPAFFRDSSEIKSGEAILAEGEAGCFYHPKKKAVVSCERCGRFLCALCDIDFHEEHICLSCLESGKSKGKIKNLTNQRTMYDYIALCLAVLPSFFFLFPSLLTAPATIYIVIRHWKSPGSIVPRTKIRFIIAFILALLQIVAWPLFLFEVFFQ